MEKDVPSTKKEFYSMINSNRRNAGRVKSDCIGTTLYLIGEREKEGPIWGEHTEVFNNFIQSKEPGLGYIVAIIDTFNEIYHTAVITNLNPLKVASKNGGGWAAFYPKKELEKVINQYAGATGHSFKEIKYFIPPKLQRILEKEAQN